MSLIKCQNGDDYPDAANKHLDDARLLLQSGHPDGAAYLSGYVVECVFKTICWAETGKKNNDHGLDSLSREALRLGMLPTARTAKYIPQVNRTHPLYDPSAGWKPQLRYFGIGKISPSVAKDWFDEAEKVFISTISKMRIDGVV